MSKHKAVGSSNSLLISSQASHWSQQHILSLLSQLIILLIVVFIVTNMVVNLGERRLQEDWADQRYSELQTVASLASDKVSFLQFRTQTIAKGELLRQYLQNPSDKLQLKTIENWNSLTENIPELLGLALFTPQGELQFATTGSFNNMQLPAALLGSGRNMGGNDIYTSPMAFTPIDGILEPYFYQLSWIENPDQSIKGYLVTYNSIVKLLETIKPAFFNQNSPLLLLDTQGFLYAGASQPAPLDSMPNTLGASLKQTYPELWRVIAMNNFGQFHSQDSTFVYLKVELTNQYENKREYFLLSYIRHEDIATRYAQWRILIIVAGCLIALLASLLIILRHRFVLERRARQNSLQLSNSLFSSELSCLIVNDSGRIQSVNAKAAAALSLPIDDLKDRSLQRVLHLDDDRFNHIKDALTHHKQWNGEINLETLNSSMLQTHIRREKCPNSNEYYWLVTFEDITALFDSQSQAYLYQLMSNCAVATALTDASGMIIKCNKQFDQLMSLHGDTDISITELLGDELHNQWQNITAQISLQGEWTAQIMPFNHGRYEHCLKTTLTGQLTFEGDIEYLICTFEQTTPVVSAQNSSNVIGHRSAIVLRLNELENYFINLSELTKEHSSLLVMDINPEGIFSNMGNMSQLEKRQKDIELQLLIELPLNYQIAQWQLGKLVILLTETNANSAHQYAINMMQCLEEKNLGEGINIGIASYLQRQSLDQYLANAEIALKRAKQSVDQNICQAFTRPTKATSSSKID
ncbi:MULTISPECIES: PAS domain-containing protein [Shewanella]|uniref:PAS domain-containing protein n=1 Tax=Shewanella psychromarinicola TaxID=2487742 RepID=A0A3N4EGY6_9GAMM|nr:PAS domain-containing protein [Shewanella psychromarinicola]AZG35021.1 PAS domain-containing protein [Shewanella psychromarinicola]MCL1080552.1 PAS domain-containing protein [Shewanella psychromarinicola]RPA33181.1 PAS domain-containing protein [Shewanella psychromarinicola]